MTAVIRIFCQTDPSLATSVVNGLLAWATFLGAGTAFGSGLAATLLAPLPLRPELRADLINRWMGWGGGSGGDLRLAS